MSVQSSNPPRDGEIDSPELRKALVAAVVVISTALLYANWIGFLASDDDTYLRAAYDWIEDFPSFGTTHWAIRYTLVLPLAAIVSIFGSSETTIVIPTLTYFIACCVCVYVLTRSYISSTVAILALFLFTMTPLFAVMATWLNVDLAELCFALLALILFEKAIDRDGDLVLLFAAGIAVGLAVISRLSALGLVIFIGLFFLRGAYFSRWRYWVIAAGFSVVIGGDAVFHAIAAGDPFHRIAIPLAALNSSEGILQGGDYRGGAGNVTSDRFLAPILSILLNQEFGLTFIMFLPAAWFCLRSRDFNDRQRRLLLHLILLAGVWFLWIGYSHTVRPLPRYFSLSTTVAVIVIATWLWLLVRNRRRWLALLLVAALLGVNLLSMIVENKSLRYAEAVLAEIAASGTEPVFTDPETARRADTFLVWQGEGVKERVHAEAPPSGALFYFVPGRGPDENRLPRPEWQEVSRHVDSRFARELLDVLGADSWLPESIYRRVAWPNPPSVLYRVP